MPISYKASTPSLGLAQNCNLHLRQINSKHDIGLSTNVVSISQRFSADPMLCTLASSMHASTA